MMKPYACQNLYEAAFLFAHGHKLLGKEKLGVKVSLLFEDSPELRKCSIEFYNGGLVSGKAYSDHYRSLKDFVFQR